MKIKASLLLVLLTLTFSHLSAQNVKVEQLVLNFLDTVQAKSYMSPKIKWDSVRPAFINATKSIVDINDLEPHFNRLIESLKDGHSRLYAEKTKDNKESEKSQLEQIATITDAQAGIPPKNFQHYMIREKYAYINIPPVILENRKYVDTIGVQLKALDAKKPKAWIIDLTENNGGNIFSMVWQFPSLIDRKETYSYIDNKGKEEKSSTRYDKVKDPEENRLLKLFNLDYKNVIPIQIKHRKVPIIILVSSLTASSGEFLTAHFKGQKNVIVIGQKTNGATSANSPFSIGNNYMVNLTIAVLKDRNGKIYKIAEGIDPDIELPIDFETRAGKAKLTYGERLKAIKDAKPIYIEKAVSTMEEKLKKH